MHEIFCICGWIFNNNEVPLEQFWIRGNLEFSEPDFYKQVTDRGSDLTGHKTYTVLGGSLRLDMYPNPAKYIKKNP